MQLNADECLQKGEEFNCNQKKDIRSGYPHDICVGSCNNVTGYTCPHVTESRFLRHNNDSSWNRSAREEIGGRLDADMTMALHNWSGVMCLQAQHTPPHNCDDDTMRSYSQLHELHRVEWYHQQRIVQKYTVAAHEKVGY